jgi:phage head maturation protease
LSTIERPKAGEVEERHAPELEIDGRKIRGRIPYRVESRDMGGWREIIEPTALRGTKIDDLVATVDHAGVPIGRYPTTLNVEDRSDGLHWSVVPPETRADVLEAITRGDLKAGSWRMVVGRDEWRGDVRHVHEIAELRDVSVVSHPSYESATVELRSAPTKENKVPDEVTENQERSEEQRSENVSDGHVKPEETRSNNTAGSLRVEERSGLPQFQTLSEAFRKGGFPEETATVEWGEFRSLTWGGTIDVLSQQRRDGVPLGADQRYAYPAFPSEAVGADVTSIQVLQQSSRTLTAGTAVVRALAATTTKPETTTATDIVTVPMKQVATVESNIPNLYLQQSGFDTLVEQDLRLSINVGLDKLVLDGIATASNTAPSTDPLLISIRKAITTLLAAGYMPDTLLLPPADAEALDVLQTAGSEKFYVFGAGRFAPGQLFGLNVRISKDLPKPTVVDAAAFGKLYVSPVNLARFEVDAGATNRSNIRMETTAAFGVERVAAASRIAAS